MRFRFVIGRALSGFFSHFSMTFAVVLVTFVSFIFVGVGLLSQVQIMHMKQHWYAKVEVSVYMCAEEDSAPNCHNQAATQEEIRDIRRELTSGSISSLVSRFHFQTNKEAYAEFEKQYAGTALAQGTTPQMLPQVFRVKLSDPSQYHRIAMALKDRPGVEFVQDQRQIVQPLFTLLSRLSLISFALAGIQIISAVLLMMTTIRLSAMMRSKEIRIMRFVGASQLFIQLPFMVETMIATLIGTALSIAVLGLAMYYGLEHWIQEHMRVLGVVTLNDVWIVSPIMVVIAIVIATFASVVALAKYAKA